MYILTLLFLNTFYTMLRSYMQNGETLERGSTSSWCKELLDLSCRYPVYLEAIHYRDFRSAHLCRSGFLHYREFLVVFGLGEKVLI